MLGRGIAARVRAKPDANPLAGIAAHLGAADLALANLECALGTRGKAARKAYTFQGPPEMAGFMAAAGLDVMTLANNHCLDYGTDALADTLALLDTAGLAHIGAGMNEADAHRPALRAVRDIRLAFLGYVNIPTEKGGFITASWRAGPEKPGVAWAEPERIASDVGAARAQAELVIVMLHSGYEGSSVPNTTQRACAHAALDAGAAAVIGAHPHVLQGAVRSGNGMIAYSLGNTVFDGLYKNDDSAILQLTLTAHGVREWSWIPLALSNGFPQPAEGARAARILRRIERLSRALES
jgi:poly-gamma-glutamate synthesis protein (capsule biosynthesis protein)